MKADVKTAWLAALRSLTYKPSSNGFLAARSAAELAPFRHSVLGVLCELAILAGVPVVKTEGLCEWLPGQVVMHYDGEVLNLPLAVQQWADAPPMFWMKQQQPSRITNIAVISRENTGTFHAVAEIIDAHC